MGKWVRDNNGQETYVLTTKEYALDRLMRLITVELTEEEEQQFSKMTLTQLNILIKVFKANEPVKTGLRSVRKG